ncbi:hypothetical protein [Saccharopolyspora taberi]|uniref:Uncharacterized protein n=1 Tax=Saccharopolyspora taberi TaxID=60895 RepID=A0ABN3VH61_9PSEU
MAVPPIPAFWHPMRRKVDCVDGFERPRTVSTYLGAGRIVLLAPPAEVALLTPESARELAEDLCAHSDVIEVRRRREAARLIRVLRG